MLVSVFKTNSYSHHHENVMIAYAQLRVIDLETVSSLITMQGICVLFAIQTGHWPTVKKL